MKKLIIVCLFLLAALSVKSQPCYEIYTMKQMNCKDMHITMEPGVYDGVPPVLTVAKFDSLNSVTFPSLSIGKYSAMPDTVVGVFSDGKLFRSPVSSLPFASQLQGTKADAALQPGTAASNITQDATHRYTTDAEKSTWNSKLSAEVDGSVTNEIELPSQSGHNGKVLGTNGISPTWVTHVTPKRQETYTGTTSSSAAPLLGTYTVTFGTTYSVAPNVQVAIQGDSPSYTAVVSYKSTTSATVKVYALTSILSLGLVPQYSGVSGVAVDIIVTEK